MNNEEIEILENKKKGSKRPYVIAIVLALVLVVTITSTSYAYFVAAVNGTSNNTVITSGSMEMEFTDGPEVNLQNAIPGSYIEKTFSVKNVGTAPTSYDVYMSELINEFADKTDLVYTLTSNDGGANKEETIVPSTPDKIVTNQSIEVGATHNYVLRITFKETNDNQDDNKGKQFSTIIRVNEVDVAKKQITLNVNNETITITKGVGISLGDITTPNVEGYEIEGLYLDSGYENRVDENTIVTTSINELYAKLIPKTDTGYKVEHYQMDTNGNYSETPYETDNLTGTTDTSVTPAVKTYQHFNSPSTQTVNINGDGSQVVKYYYERQKYTITYNANGGSVSPTSQNVYYGASISLPTASKSTKPNKLNGWYSATSGGTKYGNGGASYTVTGAVTMYAQWVYNYTIVSGNLNTVGSVVKIANEEFYVIGQQDSTHVKLLSKWNLNVDERPKGTATGLQDEDVRGFRADGGTQYGTTYFYWMSSDAYWNNGNRLKPAYGSSYPAYVYDSNSNLYQYVDAYVTYLNNQGVQVSGRLISFEELVSLGCNGQKQTSANRYCVSNGGTAPNWVYQTSYWSGSVPYGDYVWVMFSNGNLEWNTISDFDTSKWGTFGVRPVIILEK